MQNRLISNRSIFFVVLTLFGPSALAQTSDSSADEEYSRLDGEARQMLERGELGLAIETYETASRVKPTPLLFIKMVSLYADLEKQEQKLGAHCLETADVFGRFFKACDACPTTSSRECSVCRYVSRLGTGKSTSERVELLGDEFARQAKVLAAQGRSEEDEEAADKMLRKSKGFEGKSTDVRHCLAEVKISSDPAGGAVTIDGTAAGKTPLTRNLLEGKYKVEITKSAHQPVKTVVGVKAGRPTPLTFYLTKEGEKESLLVLQAVPQGVSVKVGGSPVTDFSQPIKVKPGAVILELLKPTGEGEERKVEVAAGQTRIVNLAPTGVQAQAGGGFDKTTLKWAALGGGAALLITGAVIQMGVLSDADEADALFNEVFTDMTTSDTPEKRAEISDLRDSVQQNAIIAGTAMAIGGLSIGAGIYLLLTEDKSSSAFMVTPDGVGWATTF